MKAQQFQKLLADEIQGPNDSGKGQGEHLITGGGKSVGWTL